MSWQTSYVISYHGILCHNMSYVMTIAVSLIYVDALIFTPYYCLYISFIRTNWTSFWYNLWLWFWCVSWASSYCNNTTTTDADTIALVNCVVQENTDNCDSTTAFIEDNILLLTKYMEQYDLPSAWDTDKDNLSLPDSLMARCKKRIGQQVRFDAKPLGIAMCYCCGSILWSRVDNSHTHLVKNDYNMMNLYQQ